MTGASPSALVRGLLVLVLCLAAAWPTAAQLPDYGSLTGRGQQESEPRQSRPVAPDDASGQISPRFDPSAVPSPEAYSQIADSVPDPMLDATRQAVALFRARLVSTASRLPEAWADIETTLAAASPTGLPSYFLGVALFASLLLVIGQAVAQFYKVYVARRLMMSVQGGDARGYRGKLPVLAYRVLLTAIGIAITFAVAAAVGLFFYQEHEATLITVIVVFAAYAAVLLVDTIWRMALAPYLPEYRIPAIDHAEARRLYVWLSGISAFAILSMAFTYWMQALGLAREVHTAITIVLSLVTVVLLLAVIRVHRRAISAAILSGQPRDEASWLSLAAATFWAPVIAAYLIFTWGDLSFRLVMGIEAGPLRLAAPYGIFMAGLIVYAVASYLIERVFARNRAVDEINRRLDDQRLAEEAADRDRARHAALRADDADVDADGDEAGGGQPVDIAKPAAPPRRRPGMRTMEDLARRAASLVAIGAVAWVLIRFWGGPGVFERTPGLELAQDVIDILLIGYVVFHAARIWIDGKIAEEGGDELPAGPLEGEGGGAGASRLATLLPLIRNFLLIIIGVTVALLVALELGVNVAPLFAGAGIVGLAIGFGAQTLVRDILSGAFFLMDDAFRKGEYVDVGDVKGTVEKISLRSFQLRHHLGMLHTIPFGEIQFLTNFSRDWVMMKLPLRLTYDTDIERVRKLVKKLGLRLLEDPEIGDKFIQPVKSQGVIQMDDSAMIVRIKFMTRPGEQWVLRKRIYHEIRELFAAEGIKFAHREVTVRLPDLPDDRKLTEDETRAIGAAARRVGDDVEDMLAKTGTGGMGEVR